MEYTPEFSKSDAITKLLEEDPNIPARTLAALVGTSSRYARKIRADFKEVCSDKGWLGTDKSQLHRYRALVAADIHAPYHSEANVSRMLHECKDLHIDLVVLNGDFLDCYDISFWKTDPTRMRFPDEVAEAKKVLRKITAAFPGASKVYLEGNHELRLKSFLMDKAEKLYGLKALTVEGLLDLSQMGWKFVSNRDRLMSNQAPFSLGNLFVLHGHEMRVTASAVNLPRLYFQRAMVPVLIAHHHTTQEYVVKRLDHEYMNSYTMGCLCDLSVEYMPVNNWNGGYALVEWDSSGKFTVDNIRFGSER